MKNSQFQLSKRLLNAFCGMKLKFNLNQNEKKRCSNSKNSREKFVNLKNRIGASIQIIQNKGKIPHPKERFFNSNTKEKFYNSKKGSILFEFLIVFN
jgi:hypothetical protein